MYLGSPMLGMYTHTHTHTHTCILTSVISFSWIDNFIIMEYPSLGFPGGTLVKNPPANAGDMGSIPGLEKSPGVGKGNPFQYSCLENSMDRGAWKTAVCGVAKSWT